MLSIVASAPMILLMLASSATSFQSVSFRPTSALLQISALSRRSPLSFNIQEITCSSSERIPFLKRRRLSARSRCSALCAHASVPGDNLPHVPPTLLPGMKQVLFIETGALFITRAKINLNISIIGYLLNILVYAAISYLCMSPSATSVCGLKVLVFAGLSYYLQEAAQLGWVRTAPAPDDHMGSISFRKYISYSISPVRSDLQYNS